MKELSKIVLEQPIHVTNFEISDNIVAADVLKIKKAEEQVGNVLAKAALYLQPATDLETAFDQKQLKEDVYYDCNYMMNELNAIKMKADYSISDYEPENFEKPAFNIPMTCLNIYFGYSDEINAN